MKQNNKYLKHYGVLGMKWGQRKMQKDIQSEEQHLIKDADQIRGKYKAAPGQHKLVYGNYKQHRDGYLYLSYHLVDQYGDVKLSYIEGKHGARVIAAGKDYVDKMDLNKHFNKTQSMRKSARYDVYK